MSHIVHPNEMLEPQASANERLVHPEEEDAGGNPNHLKCPKCGDTPLHYELHVKTCRGNRKGH